MTDKEIERLTQLRREWEDIPAALDPFVAGVPSPGWPAIIRSALFGGRRLGDLPPFREWGTPLLPTVRSR